VNLAVYERGNL